MSVNQPEELLTKFEQELTQAMRAVDPPAGFAERTMARAQAQEQPPARVLRMPSRSRFWMNSGAIAAMVLAGAFFGEQTHLRHERERAEMAQRQTEQAQRQFETAMQITDQTLEQVQLQLQQAGVRGPK
jgi:hypothetical protein